MLRKFLKWFGFYHVRCGFTAGCHWIEIDGHLIAQMDGRAIQKSNDHNHVALEDDDVMALQVKVFNQDLGYVKPIPLPPLSGGSFT